MPTASKQIRHPFGIRVRLVIGCSILALFFAVILESVVLSFIPSAEISRNIGWVLFLAITIVAVGYTFGFNWFWYDVKLRLDKLDPERRSKWVANYWLGGWRIFKTIGFVLLGIFWVYLLCVRFIPHLVVLVSGEQGSQEFTVERQSGVRFCRSAVEFRETPFMAGRICRVPKEIRTKLRPGMKVIVHGKKSWTGIIPESIEIKRGAMRRPGRMDKNANST